MKRSATAAYILPESSTRKRRRPVVTTIRPMPLSRRRTAVPQEIKYFDTSFSQAAGTNADWTSTTIACSNYIQSDGTTVGAYTDAALVPSAIGAGYGQVQGNKYYLKKIRIKGEVAPIVGSDQADVNNGLSVRLTLVHDTQPNGAQATGDLVFTDMGSAAQCNYSFIAMGAGAGGRFRILDDQLIVCNQVAAGTDGTATNSVVAGKVAWHMSYTPKKPIQFVLKANASTPAIASLSNNNIFLLAHSVGGGGATIIGCARAYFCD